MDSGKMMHPIGKHHTIARIQKEGNKRGEAENIWVMSKPLKKYQ